MFNRLFSKKKDGRPKDIIVVSGLPRSGTSMMMKMLSEGGLSVITDTLRTADDDNPNGYFEFEIVKQMPDGKTEWLDEAQGGVVKVISALLEHLPEKYHYKVIFMERTLREVLASQKKMLKNRAESPLVSDESMEEEFKKHLAAIKYWLARQPNMDVLYVDYAEMIRSPAVYCETIAKFVGISLDQNKMQNVPNHSLYRNRA